jgi:DNA-binding transcriptional LysR family regulator
MTIARRIALQLAQTYRLRIFAPPLPLHGFEVVMAWHPRSEGDAGVRWLKDQVRKSAGAARRGKASDGGLRNKHVG